MKYWFIIPSIFISKNRVGIVWLKWAIIFSGLSIKIEDTDFIVFKK